MNSGYGIYTTTTGSAPNRVFYIEWRAQYFPGTGNANFEFVYNENNQVLKTIYGDTTNLGSSSTEGVQDTGAGIFDQYGCNGAGGAISNGLAVKYTPAGAATSATTTASAAATTTSTTGRHDRRRGRLQRLDDGYDHRGVHDRAVADRCPDAGRPLRRGR